jgi:hypothetical protein
MPRPAGTPCPCMRSRIDVRTAYNCASASFSGCILLGLSGVRVTLRSDAGDRGASAFRRRSALRAIRWSIAGCAYVHGHEAQAVRPTAGGCVRSAFGDILCAVDGPDTHPSEVNLVASPAACDDQISVLGKVRAQPADRLVECARLHADPGTPRLVDQLVATNQMAAGMQEYCQYTQLPGPGWDPPALHAQLLCSFVKVSRSYKEVIHHLSSRLCSCSRLS